MAARRASRVPTGRLERIARLGAAAGELALGGLAQGARRLVGRGGRGGAWHDVFLGGAAAARLAKRLSRMRGAAMKLGQLLSLQGDDLVPPEFAAALAALRDASDVMPIAQLKRVLARELGKRWEDRFSRFDFEPLASASIGEVHAARAADGRELALKVQFPGVAKSIGSDLDSLAALLQFARVLPVEADLKGILVEAKRQLLQEADYRAEAGHLRRYAKLLADDADFAVPRVHDDLSTERVLAMDRMQGVTLDEVAASSDRTRRDRVGRLLFRLTLREIFDFRFVQTDPNFANYLVEPGSRGRVVLLDLGGAREYPKELSERFRRLLAAGRDLDRPALRRACVELGFLEDADPADAVDAFLDLALLIAEPMHAAQPFDFGATDLARRVSRARFEMVIGKGFRRAPPAETLFLLRKFAGTYFLCAKLGARIDVAATVDPFVSGVRRA